MRERRTWYQEKAELIDPELQKKTTPAYKKHYDHIFKSAMDRIKELGMPKDVVAQDNFRSGWDDIWENEDTNDDI